MGRQQVLQTKYRFETQWTIDCFGKYDHSVKMVRQETRGCYLFIVENPLRINTVLPISGWR